jgi:hypothetical protein
VTGAFLSPIIDVAMTAPDERPSFTLRYRLTVADVRGAFWFAARDWLPWLAGLVLLTLLCATWRPLGHTGRVAAVVFPVVAALWLLSLWNRATRGFEPFVGQDFVVSLDPDGVRLDMGLVKSEIPWKTIRRIERGGAYWLFGSRITGRFFVPAAAIPVEARAFIARWAGDAGVRLT